MFVWNQKFENYIILRLTCFSGVNLCYNAGELGLWSVHVCTQATVLSAKYPWPEIPHALSLLTHRISVILKQRTDSVRRQQPRGSSILSFNNMLLYLSCQREGSVSDLCWNSWGLAGCLKGKDFVLKVTNL